MRSPDTQQPPVQPRPTQGPTFTLRQLVGVVTAVSLACGTLTWAWGPRDTPIEQFLGTCAEIVLTICLCPPFFPILPFLPILLLLRSEARRLDDHRQ